VTATAAPSQGAWFVSFMDGMYRRMGQITRHDKALTIGVMLEIQKILEEEWEDSGGSMERLRIEGASFLFNSYCAGTRGFETVKADLKSMRRVLALQEETEN
jgi:hypothetical protein